jgi:hypothetical protein
MLGIAAGVSLLAMAAPASAQNTSPTKVRVQAKSAKVMETAVTTSDVVQEVPEGTELDVMLVDEGWYWVILPRDGYGTRRGGWVRIRDVEGADPDAVTPKEARAQARRAKREARKQAEEDKRAAKAQARATNKEERATQEALRKAAKDSQRAAKGQPTEEKQTASAEKNGAQPDEPKQKMTRGEAQQARRLKKAQDDLDKARADYDQALKKRSDPTADTTPAAPQR